MFTSRRVLYASCAVVALMAAGGGWVLADDFVVDAPSNQTNDGNILDGDDSITITQTGSIAPPAGDEAVQATGNAVTATNLGGITTSGNDARGIELFNDSTATNAGTITTVGTISHGIIVNQSSSVENSGTITTSGTNADGIFLGSNSAVTNSGTISASGDGAVGITLEDTGNTVINTGTITASGDEAGTDEAAGIDASSGNTILNSGAITTHGEEAAGIHAGDNNAITNSGTITTTDRSAEAIQAGDGNVVTNSGTITTFEGGAEGIEVHDDNQVINLGTITTYENGSEGIQGNDDNQVTNSGTITTSERLSEGIFLEDDNEVTNTGTIITHGDLAEGIEADSNNVIRNSGTISTSGDDADAMYADFQNIVVNSGTVSTSGTDAEGISVSDGNTVTNSGAITVYGVSSAGIFLNDNNVATNTGSITTHERISEGFHVQDSNTVTNLGTITTVESGSEGILGDFFNVVTNSGTISTSGEQAHGISVFDTNTVTNTGTTTTSGIDAAAIRAVLNNIVNNFGRLVSVQYRSIDLDGSTNTLNLHAPSFLGGQINLGVNATVNLFSGPSHSILWDLSTGTMNGGVPSLSGPVPIFYNSATQQVATFDPTALASSANALGDMSGNLSALMRQRLSIARAEGDGEPDPSFVSAYAADDENAGVSAIDRIATAFADTGANTGWWVSGFGSFADYDGSAATLDYTFDHVGFAAGYDWQPSSDLTLGVMAGYGMGSFDTDSRFAGSFDNTADGVFAAFYGRREMTHGLFVDFALSGGLLSHSDDRFVNDNLAPLGVSSASADYTSWWLSPEMTLGMDFDDVMGSEWSLTPSAGVRYAMQSLDGYAEIGPSAANATVSARDVAMLETRLELAGTRDIELATHTGHLTGRIGWQHRSEMGDDGTTITMIGQTNTVGASSQDGSSAYIGFDAVMDFGSSASLALGGDYLFSAHSDAYRGMATLTVAF